jgi:DNA end-binding protein Ku
VAHAIWTGTVSFGLVTVPVKLFSATKSRDVRFNQLEEATGARIRYRRVSEATGEEVPNEHIVKGYEIGPGQYVVVTDEEMKALAPAASRTIEILDFVDLDQIDPVYFEQPYYLVPDPGAVRPYRLLVEAMAELRKVAIGRLIMRSKESLVAIRPVDGALCLETMRYADEVLSAAELVGDVEDVVEPADRELEMARQLVGALAGDFEPARYRDQYRDELLSLIERKAAGEEIVAEPAAEEPAKVLDLMAALEASLARAGRPASGAEAAGAEHRPHARTRSGSASKVAPKTRAEPKGKASTKSAGTKSGAAKKSGRSRKSA